MYSVCMVCTDVYTKVSNLLLIILFIEYYIVYKYRKKIFDILLLSIYCQTHVHTLGIRLIDLRRRGKIILYHKSLSSK